MNRGARHPHETLSLYGKSTLKNLFPLFSLVLFFLGDGLFEEVCATFVLEMLPLLQYHEWWCENLLDSHYLRKPS